MNTLPTSWPRAPADDLIRAFEMAWAGGGQAEIQDYLPRTDSPEYLPVLRELVRVDMELSWDRGAPRRLTHYQSLFPQLFVDQESLAQITFEEFRLRDQAGESPSPQEYEHAFGVDGSRWAGRQAGTLTGDSATATDASIQEVALSYQAFRQRHGADDLDALRAWCDSILGSLDAARLFRGLHYADPGTAQDLAIGITALAGLGNEFEGFRLLNELGRGAFARVFLAQQRELADRPMVLKLSTAHAGEPLLLAQLQHPNIVPVYSVHRSGPIQAVCMPYLGAATLADVLHDLRARPEVPRTGQALAATLRSRRPALGQALASVSADLLLGSQSYVRAVLSIAAGMADGLAHAHERGILHRDLKPANILLTDEGQPMLLDFNLSEDTKLRSQVSAAQIGGTLPYMAPEQLRAFREGTALDGRCDLYSVGVILYELLTNHRPFPQRAGAADLVLDDLIADREQPPPPLRPQNRAVSPAVESIVERCLAADPGRRYQSAAELRTDLRRQLGDQRLQFAPEPSRWESLGKWRRRHPRLVAGLASAASIGLVAALLIGVLSTVSAFNKQRLQQLEARETHNQFLEERKTAQFLLHTRNPDAAQLARGKQACLTALDRYQVLANPDWRALPAVQKLSLADQADLVREVGEMLWALARATALEALAMPEQNARVEAFRQALDLNYRAEECLTASAPSRAVWLQRASLLKGLGKEGESGEWRARAEGEPLQTPQDRFLLAIEYRDRGEFGRAIELLQTATRQDPRDVWSWYLLGNCHDELQQNLDALACYSACIALWPKSHQFYFNRGLAYLRQGRHHEACADFDVAIQLQPQEADSYINRAVARQGLGEHASAVDDLTEALRLGTPATRVYLMRALARERAGDVAGARQDREEGLRRTPTDETSWVARGMAQLKSNPQGALADFQAAERLNPRSLPALQNQAHVLAERLSLPEKAISVLDRLLAIYPDFASARVGRGVLLARLGKRAQAHADADWALAHDASPATLYQVANIYALTSRSAPEDAARVFPLLERALRGGFGHDVLENDPDLEPVRSRPEFERLRRAAHSFRAEQNPARRATP